MNNTIRGLSNGDFEVPHLEKRDRKTQNVNTGRSMAECIKLADLGLKKAIVLSSSYTPLEENSNRLVLCSFFDGSSCLFEYGSLISIDIY